MKLQLLPIALIALLITGCSTATKSKDEKLCTEIIQTIKNEDSMKLQEIFTRETSHMNAPVPAKEQAFIKVMKDCIENQ